MEKRIRCLERQISLFSNTNDAEYVKLTEEYSQLLERFEKEGGYMYESRMRGVLTGLGFSNEEFNQPIWQLSGGQKTKTALAKLLLEKPGLLLLDEPTNHLDLDSVQWLEDFLKEYPGTLMIISHDRFFLDKLCDHILEIENRKGILYQGNIRTIERKSNYTRKLIRKSMNYSRKRSAGRRKS